MVLNYCSLLQTIMFSILITCSQKREHCIFCMLIVFPTKTCICSHLQHVESDYPIKHWYAVSGTLFNDCFVLLALFVVYSLKQYSLNTCTWVFTKYRSIIRFQMLALVHLCSFIFFSRMLPRVLRLQLC